MLFNLKEIFLLGLSNYDLKYVEACLRCLRTVFLSPCAPKGYIFEVSIYYCVLDIMVNCI